MGVCGQNTDHIWRRKVCTLPNGLHNQRKNFFFYLFLAYRNKFMPFASKTRIILFGLMNLKESRIATDFFPRIFLCFCWIFDLLSKGTGVCGCLEIFCLNLYNPCWEISMLYFGRQLCPWGWGDIKKMFFYDII